MLPSTSNGLGSSGGRDAADVVFVAKFAEDLFQDVFQSDQAGDGSKLVHNHREMGVMFAKLVH